MNIASVKVDGVTVDRPIAAFNVAEGYVDVFLTEPKGAVVVVNGYPETARLTGNVTIEWSV